MVSFSDVTSGNATRILNLAKNLSKEFDVKIIFDDNKYGHIPKQFEDLKIIFTPYLGNLYVTLSHGIIYKLIKCMKKYDIIHCFKPLPSSFIPSFVISRVRGAKLIVDWDDWEGKGGFVEFDPFFLKDFLHWLQFSAIKRADGVIAVTTFLQKISKKFNEKVYLVPNGVDIKLFHPNHRGVKIGDMFDSSLIVYVGSLYKACDLDIMIKAMKYITNKIDAKLIIVGDGPRKEEFTKLVKYYELEGNVIFVGYQRREIIPEFIRAADVVVLPMKDNLANRARSPVKLGEYLASGKAIVVSNIGIAREVIKNYHNGILTSNEPEKFGKAVTELLQNKNLKRKIEKNARRTAEEKLDWKIISKKLENVYKKVVGI